MAFHTLIEGAPFRDQTIFYILNQTKIIALMLQQYGGTSFKKIKTDDKVHVAGIAIADPDIRNYLPAMTGQSRDGD